MGTKESILMTCLVSGLVMMVAAAAESVAEVVDFESGRWTLFNGEITGHLGRKCLAGAALLEGVEFRNGIIEVDVIVDGSRSYPGLIFRAHSEGNYERFYLRPHRAGLYPDALQYTPSFNGVSGWQLYSGEGFTAGAELPANEWIHLKLEVQGSQACAYLNHADEPSLVIPHLQHGLAKGAIGLLGPKDGTAYFSNFAFRHDSSLVFEKPPEVKTPDNMLTEWEISQSVKAKQVNVEQYPHFYTIFLSDWAVVTADPTGLVDIARYRRREGEGADLVMARTVVNSDERQTVRLNFGYSDNISIFLNGHIVFGGNSGYRQRDPSFVGVVGRFDAVYLPLEKGLNEIFFFISESFGGWGFVAQADRPLDKPAKDRARLEKVWETDTVFLTPESVRYDPKRDVLYVTSFDNMYVKGNTDESTFTGYISKLKLSGEIVELKWITRLNAPCGMAIYQDRLYTVERGNLVEIDIDAGRVIERHPIPDSDFLNDIVADANGNIYMTDTSPTSHPDSRIYRFRDGRVEEWMNDGISRSNGLFLHDNLLIAGSSGDGLLKAIDLTNKKISPIACLGARIIDGIRLDNDGNYLVSHWEGQAYLITPDGGVTEILNTQGEHRNIADFEFIKDQNLLIIPTFIDNRVVAYRLVSP